MVSLGLLNVNVHHNVMLCYVIVHVSTILFALTVHLITMSLNLLFGLCGQTDSVVFPVSGLRRRTDCQGRPTAG